MVTHRLSRTVALALALAAVAAPGAAAQQDLPSLGARDAAHTSSLAGTTSTPRQDLRSPDTRDSAPGAAAPQDLRSPDARDAARTSSVSGTSSTPRQDLRSPDTYDYAHGRGTFNAPEVTVVKLAQPAPAADGGIDWNDVGIGAGSVLGLALLVLGGTFAVIYRRQRTRPMATTG